MTIIWVWFICFVFLIAGRSSKKISRIISVMKGDEYHYYNIKRIKSVIYTVKNSWNNEILFLFIFMITYFHFKFNNEIMMSQITVMKISTANDFIIMRITKLNDRYENKKYNLYNSSIYTVFVSFNWIVTWCWRLYRQQLSSLIHHITLQNLIAALWMDFQVKI